MARYWVGGTGTWDNSDTTHWASSSGGAGGASVPSAGESVNFDASSGGGTITLNYSPTGLGAINGGSHTGTFDTANNNIEAQSFSYSGSGVRTLTLGSSTISLTASGSTIINFGTTTNLTVTPNTAIFDCTYSGSTGTRTINMGALAEANTTSVKISAGTDTVTFTASNTMRNLDFTGFGAGTVSNIAMTIYGDLTVVAAATYTAGSNTWTLASTSTTTRTITTNGKTLDFPLLINGNGGNYKLGGDLTLGSTRTFTLQQNAILSCVNGASNYVISTGLLALSSCIVDFGSGTHLLTGVGTVLTNGGSTNTRLSGTGTIKITDTSNSAVTFGSNAGIYNNVWFSRGTSTGSITIVGNNFFNDFKDDGSVAHSILFTSGSVQTFKTFTVSGSAGQVITINGTSTGTHTLRKIGGGTISCNYLNIQHSIATPSGDWYAGANSVDNQATGTAGSGWNFPRYWVGGSGTWSTSDATHWSATSGGAGGATAPQQSYDVYFDSHGNEPTDGTYTVTTSGTARCHNLDVSFTGTTKVVIAGISAIEIGGSLNCSGGSAQITWSNGSGFNFVATSPGKTITMNGVTNNTACTFNGVNGGWTLQDAFNISSSGSGTITLSNGTLNTNGQTVTTSNLTISGAAYKALTLGASTINTGTWICTTPTSFLFSGASSTITCTGQTNDFGNQSYGTITLSNATPILVGDFTCVNLTHTPSSPAKTDMLSITNDFTVTGTFTVSDGATATNRVLVRSTIPGTQRKITAAAISIANADFKDIEGAGAASWDMSAATNGSGDCGGNKMKSLGTAAFTSSTVQHWTNASSSSWSTVGNWTSRVPLPQDDVVMDKAFGTSQTITVDMPRLCRSLDFTGATWTTALTFTNNQASSIFGSITLINNLTYTASSQTLTLEGRGSFTLDAKNVAIAQPVTLNAPGGTYTQSGNFTMTAARTLTITLGIFDTSNYVLSTGLVSLGTGSNGYIAKLKLNDGTHLLTGTGTVFSAASLLTTSVLDAGTSTIKITDTSATGITVANCKTLYNLWFARGTSTAINSITLSGIYNDFKDDGSVAHSLTFTAGTVNAVTTFTVSGSSEQSRISLLSASLGSKYTLLAKTGTISCDYLIIKDSLVSGGATWNAGNHSTFLTGNYFGTGFGWADAPASVSTRYWVAGGDGSWNNSLNWSSTDGGTAGASVPVGEKVYFTATPGAVTVTLANNGTESCGDLDCTGFTGAITRLDKSITGTLTVSGKFKLVSGMSDFSVTGATLAFASSGSSKTIDMAGFTVLPTAVSFTGVDNTSVNLLGEQGYNDVWTLNNNFTCYESTTITLNSGTIDANDYNVTTGLFSSTSQNYRGLIMGSGTWTLTGTGNVWLVTSSSGMTITPETSTIKITNNATTARTFAGGGLTYYNLSNTNYGLNTLTLTGSNTFNNILFNGAPKTLTLDSGGTTTATSWTLGTRYGENTLIQASTTTKHFLKSPTGSFSTDRVIITDMGAIGAGYIGTNSIIAAPNGGVTSKNTSNILVSAPSTVISGQVTLSSTGVSGALVKLIESATNLEVGYTTTDGSGNYSFYADATGGRKYHVAVEYETGGTKYNAKSLWALTPA